MNVIFISMDTLRADRLGCLGYERNLTPNLDRIAREGALFTRAFASDIPTQPAHTAIFTGRYGIRTGIVSHFHPEAQLDLAVPWLPSLFQSKGYATGAVDHLFAMKDWFVRGYTDYMPPPGRSRAPGSVILDLGLPWLDANHGDDFFLFLHFWDPHIPYLPPQPYKDRYTASSGHRHDPFVDVWLRSRPTYPLFKRNHYDHLETIPNVDYLADLYDAEVAYLDHEIGQLFSHLGELGVLENTLVVLFGDHGENMTEHDAWFDHAGLYDSVTHVPLILWAPGLVSPTVVTSLVSMVDVNPTVLELLSLEPDAGSDGRSLIGLMNGTAEHHREVVYLSECTWQAKRGVRSDEWKYIRSTDSGVYPRREPELYNVLEDPTEQTNLVQQAPEVAGEMDALLSAWVGEQLSGRADPMDSVVRAGLPAVRRLRDIIADDAAEEAEAERTGASSEEAVAHP